MQLVALGRGAAQFRHHRHPRLARCACCIARATDATIGTITPFSNNAEICSFPRFCEDNPWPVGRDPEHCTGRRLHAAAVPTYPDIPTGVGFCLYLRRAMLDAVGIFDPVFGAGYGEENDLCLRAARAGWRNVLADNAFVVHTGGRSFVGQKAELGPRNMALLLERHPHYLDMVHAYIAADPLRPLREAAASRLAVDAAPGRGVLHVIHHHGGGTETHVRALIAGVARPLASLSRHRGGRSLADRGTPRRRQRSHVRIPARRARALARLRRRNLRDFRHCTHPPAQHFSVPRRNHHGAFRFARALRLYRSRSQFRVPDDHVPRRRRNVLRRTDRRRRVLALPARPAAVRGRGHRDVARTAPGAVAARGVPDRAIALGRRHARAILPGLRRPSSLRTGCRTSAFARRRSAADARSARRRRAGGGGAGRDRPGQRRATSRTAGCPCARARRLGALRADRIHGRRARSVAVR